MTNTPSKCSYLYAKPFVISFIGATLLFGSSVVDGTGQIVLDDLQCTGDESRLVDCPHNGLGSHNCDHSQDAGVRCSRGILYIITAHYFGYFYNNYLQ